MIRLESTVTDKEGMSHIETTANEQTFRNETDSHDLLNTKQSFKIDDD